MSRTLNIAPAAKADIAAIWDYTAREYGADAADAYVTEIDAVMLRILEYPRMGAECSAVRDGYRRVRAGSHMVYYIPHKRGIEIIRVLHVRMDARRQLSS